MARRDMVPKTLTPEPGVTVHLLKRECIRTVVDQ